MEFVLSFYVHMTPDNDREFVEVDWFYKRYIQHQKEVAEANSTSTDAVDLRDMIKTHPDINNNK
jgi:hypothetical protein